MTISPSIGLGAPTLCIRSHGGTDAGSEREVRGDTLIPKKPEMEKKRAAAALCMLLLVMLSAGQQQVAAMSFCDCYQQCHPWCSQNTPWWLCNVGCAGNCAGGDRDDTLAACNMVCSTDIVCGDSAAAPADADGVEACVGECNKR